METYTKIDDTLLEVSEEVVNKKQYTKERVLSAKKFLEELIIEKQAELVKINNILSEMDKNSIVSLEEARAIEKLPVKEIISEEEIVL